MQIFANANSSFVAAQDAPGRGAHARAGAFVVTLVARVFTARIGRR